MTPLLILLRPSRSLMSQYKPNRDHRGPFPNPVGCVLYLENPLPRLDSENRDPSAQFAPGNAEECGGLVYVEIDGPQGAFNMLLAHILQ